MSNTAMTQDVPFINLADPTFSVRSQPVKDARGQSWYAKTPYGLAVLRHEQVQALLLHEKLRQGSHAWPAHNDVKGLFADWWGRTILVKEGADHARLRKLVNAAFAPRIVHAMRPQFEELANELADEIVPKGQCDFMSEFSDPYAARVLCLMLGLPREEAAHVLELSACMGLALGVSFKANEKNIEKATTEMFAYAEGIVEKRRNLPGDDFMSTLVAASEDNDRLSDEELRDMIVMLVFAGIDTTRNQLGLGMEMFLKHPDQWDLLAGKPELATKAVEEILRVRPTITWVTREAVDDFEYNGLMIARGTTLHLLSESAGTDPNVFEPGFDITADRKRHFGFGGGVHHCLGHAIARSDMAVALSILPPRITNIQPAGTPSYLPDSGNTGPIILPMAYDIRN